MFSQQQEQAVTDYLILHRLPLDVLLEVKDHMISQIADIQIDENMGFEEAFHKTQKLWESEFKMTVYSLFYREPMPVILKKIVKEKYSGIFRKSLIFGLASFTVNLLLIYFSADQEMYNDLFRGFNSLVTMIPFLYWIFKKDMRKYVRRDFKYREKSFFTMYQQNFGIFIIFINIIFQVIIREDHCVFRFFRTDEPVSVLLLILSLLLPYLLHTIIFFILISFYEHTKTLAQMKEVLKDSPVQIK